MDVLMEMQAYAVLEAAEQGWDYLDPAKQEQYVMAVRKRALMDGEEIDSPPSEEQLDDLTWRAKISALRRPIRESAGGTG